MLNAGTKTFPQPSVREPAQLHYMYVLISQIPLDFHTPDLRNYFSCSIENESFLIFNYRHRPHASKAYNVCICKIKACKFDELIKLYDQKNWLNSRGLIQRAKCSLTKIKICDDTKTESGSDSSETSLTEADIDKLLEFRKIPHWMPQGNVGTPTKTFITYINQCVMPTSLISRLGINLKMFKKNKPKKYANVQFSYNEDDVEFWEANSFYDRELDVARTGNGHSISETCDDEKKIQELNYLTLQAGKCGDNDGLDKQEEEEEEEKSPTPRKANDEDDEDDDEMEDWDRHEALHDDVTKQDRTSPYFFEKEIELKWEKGGSGLVFYTVCHTKLSLIIVKFT